MLFRSFHSLVRFGDCSTVKVMGKGDIEIRTKNGFSPLAYSSGHNDHQNVGLPPAQSLNLLPSLLPRSPLPLPSTLSTL